MAVPWAEIASAAGGLLSAGLNVGATSNLNRKNRQWQEKMNKRNERFMREMNAYNSPVSQMARYTAAGLNPMAVQDGIDPGLQSGIPEQVAPHFEAADYGGIGDAVNNTLQYRLQESMNKSKINLNNANAIVAASRSRNIDEQTNQLQDFFGLKWNKLQAEVSNLEKQYELFDAEIAKLGSEKGNIEALTELYREQKKKVLSDIGLNEAQIRELDERVNMYKAQETALYQQARQYAAMAQISEQTALRAVAYTEWYLQNNGAAAEFVGMAYRNLNEEQRHIVLQHAAKYAMAEDAYNDDMAAYRAAYYRWQSEDMQNRAGISWDEWNQGQGRKNYETYVLGTLDTILGGAAAVASGGASVVAAHAKSSAVSKMHGAAGAVESIFSGGVQGLSDYGTSVF